jgi:hypothetical protein
MPGHSTHEYRRKGRRILFEVAQSRSPEETFSRPPMILDANAVPFATNVVCAKCGARGRHIDVRPNWKEQPTQKSLTGKHCEWLS